MAVDAWRDPRARDALAAEGALVALAGIALVFVAPNLSGTQATASPPSLTPPRMPAGRTSVNLGFVLEFIGSQFAVFGPILFAVLARRMPGARCGAAASSLNCRLLAFSIPVILLLVVQALFSRALANWAAAAYPAATILVTAVLLRHWPRLFRDFAVAASRHGARHHARPGVRAEITRLTGPEWNPYARVMGWREMATATRDLAERKGQRRC